MRAERVVRELMWRRGSLPASALGGLYCRHGCAGVCRHMYSGESRSLVAEVECPRCGDTMLVKAAADWSAGCPWCGGPLTLVSPGTDRGTVT